jgi:hypothetical protein
LIRFQEASRLSDQLQADIHERNRLVTQGVPTARQNAVIRGQLTNLQTKITQLENAVNAEAGSSSKKATAAELDRRMDLVANLNVRKDQLWTLYRSTDSDGKKTDLMGSTKAGGGRAFGAAAKSLETEQTRGLDNNQILQQQREAIKEQDKGLDKLSESIQKQKQLGLTIHDELVQQTAMLGELEDQVDGTTGLLKKEQSHVLQVLKESKMNGLICCVVLLIIIFVVLALTNWGCDIIAC